MERLKAKMAYHAQLKEWLSEKFEQPLTREILTKLGTTTAYKEGMEKIGSFEWVKKALGYPEANTQGVEVSKRKARPMGDVDIEITRDFKTITAHVEIAYFRRPEPSTYWIDGDRGDEGEVILGDVVDDCGRELVLSLEEQDQAIEAFKDK